MKSSVEDAYAAGILDGEGCITISRVIHKTGSVYAVRIDVGMTAKANSTLKWLQSHYGGTLRQARKATDRWCEATAWAVFGKEAAQFLEKVSPFLLVKPEQARLAIRLQEIVAEQRGHWSAEARKRGETIRLRVQELNRKGPEDDPPTAGWIARRVAGQWVTPQADLFTDLGWESYSDPFPISGTMRNGYVYPRPTWARHTSAGGSSSWPTPQAQETGRSPEAHLAMRQALAGGARGVSSLAVTARLWPTPTGPAPHDSEQTAGLARPKRPGYGMELPLAAAIVTARQWPTPKASAENYGQPQENDRGDLQVEVGLWQTPRCAMASIYAEDDKTLAAPGREGRDTLARQAAAGLWARPQARDWKSGAVSETTAAKNSRPLSEQVNAYQSSHPAPETLPAGDQSSPERRTLNPLFVSWLMGLPPEWASPGPLVSISCEAWVILSVRSLRRLLSPFLCKDCF